MNRLYIILVAMLASPALWAQPQLSPKESTVHMGQVQWKRQATASFLITNTGTAPLVLTDVQPGCACTVADWTRTAIAPNATGEIDVTYDAELLGRFDKSVAVYSNASEKPAYLHLAGQVVQRVSDLSRSHPHRIGDVRLDTLSIDFPNVGRGAKPHFHLGVANVGDIPWEPVLMHLPAYIGMEVDPPMLQPGEQGDIFLSVQNDSLLDLGLTQTTVYLSRFTGDVVGVENELPLSVVILPDFSALTQAEKDASPRISLSATRLDFSQALAAKGKARQQIVVRNDGATPLRISKIQVLDSSVNVSLRKSVLKPGEQAKMRVEVFRGKARPRAAERPLGLVLITNDYLNPMVRIDIKGK